MHPSDYFLLNVLSSTKEDFAYNFVATMGESNDTSPSEKTTECKNCARRIITQVGLYVVCDGPCRNSFHISCIGMSKEQLQSRSNGVLWLCNTCLPCFHDWKQSIPSIPTPADTIRMQNDITELKSQVSRILNSLEGISPNKTQRSEFVLRHSTPVTSAGLMNGSNISYENASAIERDQTEQNDEQDQMEETSDGDHSFSLLLTNIDSAASEKDVMMMVCGCLNAPASDCESVIKLVPRRLNCSLLDFVSFKVVLKWRWKSLAMSASTWPIGIQFREFINRKNNTWKPRTA